MALKHAGEFFWSIDLWVNCPHCEHNFDAFLTDDFTEQTEGREVGEGIPDRDVQCPHCEEEFIFDIGSGL